MGTINRAPFNALVDDDGSNTIGSPWNKAAIAGVLLNPIDALVGGLLVAAPFTAADYTANNGATWTMPGWSRLFYQVTAQNVMSVYFSWEGAVVAGGPPSNLLVKIPGGRVASATALGVTYVSVPAYEVGVVMATQGANTLTLYRPAIGAFPAGAATGYVGITFPVF